MLASRGPRGHVAPAAARPAPKLPLVVSASMARRAGAAGGRPTPAPALPLTSWPARAAASSSRRASRRSTVSVRAQTQQQAESQAQVLGLTVQSVTSALLHAQQAYEKYDTDKSGSLDIEEAVAMLNSPELQEATRLLVNVSPRIYTVDDVKEMFKKADADKSGCLGRVEFLGLYLGLSTQRIKHNPFVLAEALLGFIDHDRNGRIEGRELKLLLTLVGFHGVLLLPIPNDFGVDYRSILRTLGGNK